MQQFQTTNRASDQPRKHTDRITALRLLRARNKDRWIIADTHVPTCAHCGNGITVWLWSPVFLFKLKSILGSVFLHISGRKQSFKGTVSAGVTFRGKGEMQCVQTVACLAGSSGLWPTGANCSMRETRKSAIIDSGLWVMKHRASVLASTSARTHCIGSCHETCCPPNTYGSRFLLPPD
jgi:hypothetical protein